MARNIRDKGGRKEMQPPTKTNIDDILSSAPKEYAGKNEDELMSELTKSIAAGKKDGSITQDSLRQFVSTVSPMLNNQQKAKLNDILKKFK